MKIKGIWSWLFRRHPLSETPDADGWWSKGWSAYQREPWEPRGFTPPKETAMMAAAHVFTSDGVRAVRTHERKMTIRDNGPPDGTSP